MIYIFHIYELKPKKAIKIDFIFKGLILNTDMFLM